jgi:acetoin utilization protein AcuB
MLVRDYMTASPVTIREDADYGAAFAIMEDKDLHHLPVLNADGHVVGILARRDLQLAARFLHEAPAEVCDVMHAPVVTIEPGSDLTAAVVRMMDDRIGCLPVCEDGQQCVGIITETDLFRALRDLLGATKD